MKRSFNLSSKSEQRRAIKNHFIYFLLLIEDVHTSITFSFFVKEKFVWLLEVAGGKVTCSATTLRTHTGHIHVHTHVQMRAVAEGFSFNLV